MDKIAEQFDNEAAQHKTEIQKQLHNHLRPFQTVSLELNKKKEGFKKCVECMNQCLAAKNHPATFMEMFSGLKTEYKEMMGHKITGKPIESYQITRWNENHGILPSLGSLGSLSVESIPK